MIRTLDTPCTVEECADVPFERTAADELVADEVRIVRARDVVLRQRPVHVLPDLAMLIREGRILTRDEESRERRDAPQRRRRPRCALSRRYRRKLHGPVGPGDG